MTLDKLNTPFERRRVIEYGKDGNKAVRHWYEVQQVAGSIYKTRDFPNDWGTPQFKLYIFFDGVKDGLKWLWLSSPEYYEVDVMVSTAKHEHMDSAPAMLCDLFARMEAGKFIGNAEIEFVRQFDRTAAERFAKYRLDYYARREEQERQERLEREAVEEAEKSRKEAELEAGKAKYYGWADTMTPMRFGKVRAKMEGVVRADGKVMSLRDFVTGLVKDGWEPAKRDGVTRWYGSKWEPKQSKPRTEYVLARDGCSYKVSKTEYDFAVYLTKCKEILGQ